MEKFMQRENILLGLSSSPNGLSSRNSSKAPFRNSSSEESNMDFNDVFGGPPRRFSMQEVRVRYSFGETSDQSEEKPVFGEDTAATARRRHQGVDFFDDIFKGDDSSPRRPTDSVFGSNPGSRVMSPARPLPPNAEPFGTSLPAQLSLLKGTEYPTFGSRNQSPSSTSRFVNQAIRQSPLSREASVEDLSTLATSHQKGNTDIMKKETKNVDNSVGDNFHFSIYKWAGSGVPMLTPLVAWNNLKTKDNKKDSSNEVEFLKVKREDKNSRSKQKTKEVKSSLDDQISKQEKKEVKSAVEVEIIKQEMKEVKNSIEVTLPDESDIGKKMKKEVSLKMDSSLMSEVKPPENVMETKETDTRTTKGVHTNARLKKNEEIKIDSKNASVEKSSKGKGGVKGKVREFVQILNQEADLKIKSDVSRRSQTSRWKSVEVEQKEKEVILNAEKANEKVNLQNIDKSEDVSVKMDENKNSDKARKISPMKTPDYASSNFPTRPKKSFSSDNLRRDSKISVENSDDPFEVNFMVEELSDDHDKVTQSENSEDTEAIDAKIRQWSFGKKGNIRSLLSTLQYVLWDGSGWKPVPLVDLIEANSVKRAYQKALLRLHPDKLQQKGAAFQHKYIAEKVFDILQEAWDHFNTLAPL